MTVSFVFFSVTISLPVSATITVDPAAYAVLEPVVKAVVTTTVPSPVTVDPPPYAFAVPGVHNLTGIRGKLAIDGGTGNDSVVVHDKQGEPGSGTLDANTLNGLGMGANGVKFDNIESLDVRLGPGDDTLTIEQTIGGNIRIDAGAGSDAINVKRIVGDTTLWGGAGDDTFTVHDDDRSLAGIAAVLEIDGDAHLSEQTVNWVDGEPSTIVPNSSLVVDEWGAQYNTGDQFGTGPAFVKVATLNPDGSTQTDSDGNVITHMVPLPFPIKATFLESRRQAALPPRRPGRAPAAAAAAVP